MNLSFLSHLKKRNKIIFTETMDGTMFVVKLKKIFEHEVKDYAKNI